ncbi:MAG: hypothetical protein IPP15_23910 [Saprospiraceae bacterium]|uniref:Uncharacterized protein n=1 Tax=Candidatus Opimibacter skivensis TaxID=2982028 RepID=A0A9D7XW59_9BACT|nr:hypothetical protein [Candidatus Opimibacter skivensis]
MTTVKIGIKKLSVTSELDDTRGGHSNLFAFTQNDAYLIWFFSLVIADESNAPILNLTSADFTFNFLKAGHVFEISAESQDPVLRGVQHPVQFHNLVGRVRFVKIWQLVSRVKVMDNPGTNGGSDDHYPADWFEVIINSTSANVHGNAMFYLH